MSLETQLDPISRHLLATMGRALIALSTGEIDLNSILTADASALDLARRELHAGDGLARRRRYSPRRRCYSLVKDASAKKLATLTPAGRAVAKVLDQTPKQTLPQLVQGTGLSRKTVENQLGALNTLRVLVRGDVLEDGRHA